MLRKSGNWQSLIRLVLMLALISAQLQCASPFTYEVEAGDELSIDIALVGSLTDLSKLSTGLPLEIIGESVYSHRTIIVTPDGYLFLPGLPPLKVQGLLLAEVEKSLVSALKLPPYHHSVSVALVHTNSMAIHIWGEVKQPGRFMLDHPTDLMEAISYAGGPTELARMNKILLIRKGETARRIDLSTKRLRREGGSQEMIKPGDTIVIPRKWTVSEFAVLALLSFISTASAVYVASKVH